MSTTYTSGQIATGTVSDFQEVLNSGAKGQYQSVINTGQIVVNSGATLIEQNGSSLYGPYSGGKILVYSGGTLVGGSIGGGGVVLTTPGATISGGLVVQNGGLLSHWSSKESGATLASGAVLYVQSGGNADGIVAGSGANIIASSGGIVSGTIISSGGALGVAGTASNTTVSNGGIIDITSGGIATGNTINGGSAYVEAGGVINSATLENSGRITVSTGASANNVTVETLGILVVSGGGAVSGTVVSNGGQVGVAGTASATTVNSGGVVDVASGGNAATNTVNNGGTLYAEANSILGATTVSSGGQVSAASGATLSGALTLQNGGSATIWNNTGGTVDLQGSTNGGLTVSGLESGGTLTTVISGFDGNSASNSDVIKLEGVKAADVTSVTYPDANHVTLTLSGGASVTMNIIGAEAAGYTLGADSDGDLVYEVCFLTDSLIKTPAGDVAVQNLRFGDDIVTYDNGQERVQKVVWAGQTQATVRTHLPVDEAGYPVRILRNAIADGVPYKDMLITAEHCLYFEGKFVPARMLVNGRSVFYDTSITSYDYYHIETESHSVIMADGMLTESYLDTGNRRAFQQAGSVIGFATASTLSWEDDAAVKLDTSRVFVEPIFRKIEARAEQAGLAHKAHASTLTESADLHLVTEKGQIIHQVRESDGQVLFMIPADVNSVHIVSRTSRPIDVVGPFVDDRRHLGVLVGAVSFLDARDMHQITTHLTDATLTGWSEQDSASCRWTNGYAHLPLNRQNSKSFGMLSLKIQAAGPYLADTEDHSVKMYSA